MSHKEGARLHGIFIIKYMNQNVPVVVVTNDRRRRISSELAINTIPKITVCYSAKTVVIVFLSASTIVSVKPLTACRITIFLSATTHAGVLTP
ncbi:hypothetical protein ABIE26_001576 [Pedobacter africanus]